MNTGKAVLLWSSATVVAMTSAAISVWAQLPGLKSTQMDASKASQEHLQYELDAGNDWRSRLGMMRQLATQTG